MLPTRGCRTDLFTYGNHTGNAFGEAVSVRLIKVPFTPADDTIFVDADEADFDGYAGIDITAGSRSVYEDPSTSELFCPLPIPAGGWQYPVTGNTHLPETIYGYVVMGGAAADPLTGGQVLATALFDSPIVLTILGQVIEIPDVKITLRTGGIS